MLDKDHRFPFVIDTSRLRFFGSHDCLGKLIALVMHEARHVRERPKGTHARIVLAALSDPVGDDGYALIVAQCEYLLEGTPTGSRNIFAVYHPTADAVFDGIGQNLDLLIEQAEAWNPASGTDGDGAPTTSRPPGTS